jgi:Fe-S oxidoreductase
VSVHDLMQGYIKTGRIKINKGVHEELTTYHDPCNYGRKSQVTFGHGYFEEPRWVTRQCCENLVEMYPNRMENFCCGAGGGAWAAPYAKERIFYGRRKAEQIKATGAKLVVAPCHNCRDQIMKSLRKEYDFMDVEVKYLWELVADSLVIPGIKPKEKAH